MRIAAPSYCLVLALPGCIVIEDKEAIHVEADVLASSHYVHRGMTENERGVIQAQLNDDFDTTLGGALGVHVFGNMDMNDETGDAWYPDGHERKFTEIDLAAQYSQQFAGTDVTAGIESYTLPNGLEFPNGERGSTTELFARVGHEVTWGLYPQLELRADYDEADGWYLNLSVRRDFPLPVDRLHLDLMVSQGFIDEDQAFWEYGFEETGWADLRGEARLLYDWDDHTTFHLTIAGSTMIDQELQDWFQLIGIRDDVAWIAAGVTFRY
jgi:hypothetical protein